MTPDTDSKKLWEESFDEQIAREAYNTAPVEAIVRTVSYHLRDRVTPEQRRNLRFLEMGCGAGPNLVWLAQKGIQVSGVDIAANALQLARANLERAGCGDRIGELVECSVEKTPFADGSFDGILESCVFQHLDRDTRTLVPRAIEQGVAFIPGGPFFVDGSHQNTMRLTFAKEPDDRMREGVARLASVLFDQQG